MDYHFLFLSLVMLIFNGRAIAITFQQGGGNVKYALDCDFNGGDILNQPSTGEQCGGICEGNSQCTRFTWANWQGGTCWLKNGPVSESSAVYNQGAVCGYVTSRTVSGGRQISFTNRCNQAIWVSPLTNGNGAALPGGIQKLGTGATYNYQIPNGGWGGRFWPKLGCDASGQNCQVGQSTPPCPASGCQPPADTKVEFFFPQLGNANTVWYDVSLVDGYSLPATITPSAISGSCVTTHCDVALSACPTGESNVGDLRVIQNGQTVQCLAPCKKWNFPSPYGLGKQETQDPGLHLCCPTPPVSPSQCRAGIVVNTQYVSLIHKTCPSAYSYAYDDEAGLHNCPNNVNFAVSFC